MAAVGTQLHDEAHLPRADRHVSDGCVAEGEAGNAGEIAVTIERAGGQRSVTPLITLLIVRFAAKIKPGNCATVTLPTPGIDVVLLPFKFHCVASAMSPGER